MPISKKSPAVTPKKTAPKAQSSKVNHQEELDALLNQQSGRRVVEFSMQALKAATKGKYGKYTLIATDGLPVEYSPKTFKEQFVMEDGMFTLDSAYYATTKGSVWPVED